MEGQKKIAVIESKLDFNHTLIALIQIHMLQEEYILLKFYTVK